MIEKGMICTLSPDNVVKYEITEVMKNTAEMFEIKNPKVTITAPLDNINIIED